MMDSLDIDAFISYLESEQRASSNTVEAYERDLHQFGDWVCPDRTIKWGLVSTSDIREWIGTLADSGLAATSLRRKAQSLRAFFHWAHKKGLLPRNPARDLPLVKKGKHLPDFIKEKDIEQLLATTGAVITAPVGNADTTPGDQQPTEMDEFTSARTHLVLTLLYSLGLRQAELLGLTDGSLSGDGRELRVLGKRNKERILPVPEDLAELIHTWQIIRDMHLPDLPEPRPLVAGPNGAISKSMLYRIVRDGLNGVPTGRKSPHTLRHTFATAMLNHGADIDAVREMLGHASLQTTQIYTHVSYKELLSTYRTAHPRASKQKDPQ